MSQGDRRTKGRNIAPEFYASRRAEMDRGAEIHQRKWYTQEDFLRR